MQPGYRLEQIWSMPIRLWHWALVLSVTGGWLLGEFRTFSTMQWHMYAGYTTGTLLIFRLYWGLFGPPKERFKALLFSRPDVKKYAGKVFVRQPSGFSGHNPIGAMSVILMLFLFTTQVISGLFSEDDGLFSEGPLAAYVSDSTVLTFTSVHSLNSRAILIIVSLHILAILFYLIWKYENLIKAMLTGGKVVKK